jgi:hypothetical protein
LLWRDTGRYQLRSVGKAIFCISDIPVFLNLLIRLETGAALLFEALSYRFSATIPVPGKGTTPEVTPEVGIRCPDILKTVEWKSFLIISINLDIVIQYG